MTTDTKLCDCPEDAETVVGNVIVTGHNDDCVHGEPRRYIWRDGGYGLCVGTLADYAKAWEAAYYDGARDEISAEVRTWDASYTVEVKYTGTDEQDCICHTLTVGNERVAVHIDGRV